MLFIYSQCWLGHRFIPLWTVSNWCSFLSRNSCLQPYLLHTQLPNNGHSWRKRNTANWLIIQQQHSQALVNKTLAHTFSVRRTELFQLPKKSSVRKTRNFWKNYKLKNVQMNKRNEADWLAIYTLFYMVQNVNFAFLLILHTLKIWHKHTRFSRLVVFRCLSFFLVLSLLPFFCFFFDEF